MRPRKLTVLFGLVCIASLLCHATSSLYAQEEPPFADIVEQEQSGFLPIGLAAHNGYVTVLAELQPDPLPVAQASSDPLARQARMSEIKESQDRLRSALPSLQAREIYASQSLFNAVALSIPRDRVAELGALPDVKALQSLQAKQLGSAPALDQSVSEKIWKAYGATGSGLKIAIIDSGIDYTHADFGGSGNRNDYVNNNRTIIEPNSFPTTKVVGGYDFAGDLYHVTNAPIPLGDPDPLDCNGHGTAIASVAAGYGVDLAGNRYNGPYDRDLLSSDFRLLPGSAPEASLYALKVTGCSSNQTHLVIPALEWAIDPNGDGDSSDRVDVVVIALGSAFGSANDPEARAVQRAFEAGVVVVAAAGESEGSTFYSIQSPASAPAAIAVVPVFGSENSAVDSLVPNSARGPLRDSQSTKPDLGAAGYQIGSAAYGSGNAVASASGSAIASAHVGGAVALLRQLRPNWSPLQLKAALLNTSTPLQNPSGSAYAPTQGGLGRIDLAAAAATKLIAYADDGSGGVGLDYGLRWEGDGFKQYHPIRIDNLGDQVQQLGLGSFPASSQSHVAIRPAKVDLAVPAGGSQQVRIRSQILDNNLELSIDSAVDPTQNDFRRFAVAEHAGSIYLVDQAYSRIRIANDSRESAIDVYLNGQLIAAGLGYGHVSSYIEKPAGSYQLVYRAAGSGSNGPSLGDRTLNIGAGTDVTMIANSKLKISKQARITTWTLNEAAVQASDAAARVRFANNNPPDALEAERVIDVYVDDRLVSQGLDSRSFGSFIALQVGQHQVRVEASNPISPELKSQMSFALDLQKGSVTTISLAPLITTQSYTKIDSQPRRTLRVPYALGPRPAQQASVSLAPLASANSGSLTATVRNPFAPANKPVTPQPYLGAFQLSYEGTSLAKGTSIDAARIKYLGIASNLHVPRTLNLPDSFFVAIVSQDNWATPNEVDFQVYFDLNNDNISDRVLVNTSLGYLQNGQPSDTFIANLYTIERFSNGSRRLVLNQVSYLNGFGPGGQNAPDLVPYDRNTLFMQVNTEHLGISASQSRFRYRVETRHLDAFGFRQIVDSTTWIEVDLNALPVDTVNPSVELGYMPIYPATDRNRFEIRVDSELAYMPDLPRLMMIYFHNPPDQQVEIVPLK
jgi:subtilisin family serine protease